MSQLVPRLRPFLGLLLPSGPQPGTHCAHPHDPWLLFPLGLCRTDRRSLKFFLKLLLLLLVPTIQSPVFLSLFTGPFCSLAFDILLTNGQTLPVPVLSQLRLPAD